MKVSELIGLDTTIERIVKAQLKKQVLLPSDIKEAVKVAVDLFKADVYDNMKSIEQFKYKQIELDTKLDNLTTFCKAKNKEGG